MAIPSKDELRKQAELIDQVHAAYGNRTPDFSEENRQSRNYIGLVCERRFAIEFGEFPDIQVDMTVRPYGDKGIDFKTPLGILNVKGAQKPYHLPLKIHENRARVYVLGHFKDDDATLIGWTLNDILGQCPTRKFIADGPINHYLHHSLLIPMQHLKDLMRWIAKGGPWMQAIGRIWWRNIQDGR